MEEEEINKIPGNLNKKDFEKFMNEKKPYLNPRLKITELASGLYTNRSYLSAFINMSYNMNFNRYINRCRLEEMEKMKQNPAYINYRDAELAVMAGFSNYKGYKRIKKAEDATT